MVVDDVDANVVDVRSRFDNLDVETTESHFGAGKTPTLTPHQEFNDIVFTLSPFGYPNSMGKIQR